MFSSFVSGRQTLTRSLSNPNRPLMRINPRNPCSAADPQLPSHNLGSTQGYRTYSPSRFRFLRHAGWKSKTLRAMEQRVSSKYESLLGLQRTQMEKMKKLIPADGRTPAIVSCKATNSLFKNPTIHLSIFDSEGALLKGFSKPIIQHPHHGGNPFLVSACRNLLLLMGPVSFLCNITTEELLNLPDCNGDGTGCLVGFGYVPSTKEFKVLTRFLFSGGLDLKVLTLGTNRWRDVQNPPPPDTIPHDPEGVASGNGAIHFLSSLRNRIVTFDLEREEWESIEGPPVCPTSPRSLKELSGYLCMVADRGSRRSIWLWDYNNASWIKLCTFSLYHWNGIYSSDVKPLAIENDWRVLVLVDMFEKYSLQSYDPKTKRTPEICHFNKLDNQGNFNNKLFSSSGINW